MKKIILLMLITALIAVPVLSCAADDGGNGRQGAGEPGNGESANGPGDAAEPAEQIEEALAFPDLPDINFGGYDFRILNTREGAQAWILTTLVVEAETGEALNDAIFRRNRRMEDRFGFNLVEIGFNNPGQARDRARVSINAGSDDFDMAMMNSDQALAMAQEGLLEMIDRIPHIDLSQPWWDRDMIRDFSIGGRIFSAAGDFTFNHYSVTLAIFFNKQMHEDLGLDCPYTLVHEGRWTLDRMAEMARAALRDLTGDGTFGNDDQWGFVSNSQNYTNAILTGIGARFVVKDANDIPVLNMNTEGFISRFNTAFDAIQTDGWLFDSNRPGTADGADIFLNNRALFWVPQLNRAIDLRAMDTDFGLLPFPKLNEQQEYHISAVGPLQVMTIPVTAQDLERTGIILEALSAESRLTTLDVYYDTMLVNQLMNRDEESAEMLDIMFANRVYDIGRHFWAAQITNPVQNAMRDMNRDIASIIETQEGAAMAAIEATINAFLD